MISREAFYAPDRVLVISAHADDIEFGMSGTVARWTALGTHVTYCIVTDNSSGSNDPNTNLQQLIETRKAESIASAAVAGVHDVIFLGDKYKDGTLEPTIELRKDLTRVVRRVRPNVVLSFDPEVMIASNRNYINHPDHRAVAQAALYAVFPSAESRPIFSDLLDEGLEPHKVNKLYLYFTDKPTLYVNIAATIEKKKDALRCHVSQLNEDTVKWVVERSAKTGETVGVEYAEVFRVIHLNDDNPQAEDHTQDGNA